VAWSSVMGQERRFTSVSKESGSPVISQQQSASDWLFRVGPIAAARGYQMLPLRSFNCRPKRGMLWLRPGAPGDARQSDDSRSAQR
jgi:hypothetical protein